MEPPVQSDRNWDVPLDCRLIFLSFPHPFSILPLPSKRKKPPGCLNFFFFNRRPEVAKSPVTAELLTIRHAGRWLGASSLEEAGQPRVEA